MGLYDSFVPGGVPDSERFQKRLEEMQQVMREFTDGKRPPMQEMGFVERLQRTGWLDPGGPARKAGLVAAQTLPGMGHVAQLASSTATSTLARFQGGMADRRRSAEQREENRAGMLSELFAVQPDDSELVKATKRAILGPAVSLLAEPTGPGFLTPEESQRDAEEQAERARKAEQATKDQVTLRRQSRQLTSGVVDEGQTTGGMRSVLMGGETLEESVAGQEQQELAAAAEDTAEAQAAVTDPSKQRTQSWWLNAGRNAMKSIPQTVLSLPRGVAIMNEMATAGFYEQGKAREWIDSFDKAIDKLLPTDDARDKEFLTQVAAGTGSMLGYLITAFGVGAAGGGGIALGLSTAIMQGGRGFEEAETVATADNISKLMSFTVHAGIGLTEAIPIMNMLGRAERVGGGMVSKILQRSTIAAQNGLEELIQEVGQSLGEDLWAEWWHDLDRDMSVRKYVETGAAAFLSGAIGGGIGASVVEGEQQARTNKVDMTPEQKSAMDALVAAAQPPAEQAPDDTEAAAARDAIVAGLEEQFDALPGMQEAGADADAEDLFSIRVPQLTPVDEADVRELANAADAALTGEPAAAIDDFVAHPPGAIDTGREGSGIMRADRLEAIARGEQPEAERQLEEAFDPIRERLRELVGDTIRLFRVQRAIDPDRRVAGMPEDGQRFALSWTSNPDFARDLAGLQNRRLLIPESEIVRMEREFEENGRVDIAPGRWLERVTETIGDEQVTYIAIMGTDGMVTDTDSVRAYVEDLNQWRREDMASDDQRAGEIIAADVNLYDVMWVTDRAGQSEFIVRNSPENPQLHLPATGERPSTGLVHRRGGTIPVDADGMHRITHESDEALDVIDPAKRGSKGLGRGAEGARLGPPGNTDPDVVDRSYFGVGDLDFRRPRGEIRRESDPYHGESLGHIRHTVAVDPNTIYNALEDPLRLWSKVPTDIGSSRRLTRFERLVRDAGFKGLYYERSEKGQITMMFEPTTPERVVDKRHGLPVAEIATPEDFRNPTPETFRDKGGWAIITATKESVGDFNHPDNVKANTKLRNTLRRRQIPFMEVDGTYQGVDQGKSLLIFAPEKEALALGAQFGQESVLTRKGLEFTDGSGKLIPAVHEDTKTGDDARAQDFVSVLPNGEAFSVGLDFGGEIDFLASMADRSPAELIDQIELDRGELDKLPELPGNSTGPIERVVRAARAYAEWAGLPIRRQDHYVAADPDRGERIAQAYEEMEHAPNDPAVQRAYQAMIDETLAQYQFVKASGITIEAIEPGQDDPYAGDLKAVLRDIDSGHLWFFPTDQGFGGRMPPVDENAEMMKAYTGKWEMVPIEWLDRIPGNALGRSDVAALAADIEVSGVQSPLILNVGKDSRTVELGEGNHRLAALKRLGYTHAPVRVVVGREWGLSKGFNADTDLIPIAGEYFSADAAPSQVFKSLQQQGRGDNPLLAPTGEFIGDRELLANDVFRIVHDFFGHGIEGSGFGARGEENAWQSHMRLYSQAALPAVTSETRGQNSWVNFGPFGEQNRADPANTVFADQKTGIMPQWTWHEGVADDLDRSDPDVSDTPDLLAAVAPKPRENRGQRLMDEIPGLKGVAKHMTPEEQAKLRRDTAQKVVDIFTKLPDPKEMAAVAISGRAKRGWYARSGKALVDIFGIEDAPRFAALLAALSPQVSVESNAVNALRVWTAWVNQGRPTDQRSIRSILAFNVQGDKGEKSVLNAWVPNSIEALTNPDPATIELSGPKVSSFMFNLRGVVNEVTNDAWMANYANVAQKLFQGSNTAERRPGDTRKNVLRKTPGYIAMAAAVRRAADVATNLTGDKWTPAEIQETIWSWAKTLYEKSSSSLPAEQLLAAGQLTAEEISATPDFATLFATGVYKTILERGGYNVDEIAAGSERDGGRDVSGSDPLSAEGTGLAKDAFERHLRRAARRLDALRRQRDAEEAETRRRAQAEDVTPEPALPRDSELESLMDADAFFARAPRGVMKGERQRPAGGIPGRATDTDVDLTFVGLGRSLAKLLALTARQGRLSIKGSDVLGQYMRSTGVIRTRSVGDFPVLVHEAGHALHMARSALLGGFVTKHEKALMKIADELYGGDTNTMSKSVHVAEGFAEFFRAYVTHRAYIDGRWPQLGDDMDTLLRDSSPDIFKGLQLIRMRYDRIIDTLPSAQAVRNMVVPGRAESKTQAVIKELKEKGVATWWQERVSAFLEGTVNQWIPLNILTANVLNIGEANKGTPLDLKVSEDPRKMIALAANSSSLAMVEARDGIAPRGSLTPATRSLRDMMAVSQGARPEQSKFNFDQNRADDFDAYVTALRGVDEWRRYDEGKISRPPFDPRTTTRDDLVQAIKDYEAQYPEFVEAAEIAHEVNMAMWDKAYAAGLMDKETYEDGLDRRFYVPLLRDMSDKRSEIGRSGLSVARGQKLVHRFEGSDRLVVSPTTMMMQKLFALEQAIAKNDIKVALAMLADKAGTAGAMVERIPANALIGHQLSVREAAMKLAQDPTLTATEAQDLMTLLDAAMEEGNIIQYFRAKQISTAGQNIVFFWEKGKIQAMQLADGELGASVVELLDGIGQINMPFATSLITGASQLMRAGIIHWPDYILMNFARDQFQTWILSDVGFIPFASGLRGAYDEITQSRVAKLYNLSMTMMGGAQTAALHEARVDRDIRSLRAKGYLAQVVDGGPLGALARATEVTETGTRMGLWKNAYLRGKADGLSDYDAAIEAAYIATDIMNFGMHGSRMAFWRRTIPFLNSQLVGFYKLMRTLGADEVRQRKGLRFVLGAYFKNENRLPLTRTEKAAVRTGRKAWVKMSALALLSTAIHFAFEDDEDYQETSEYLRATGWVIPLGDGRIFYYPKPFELALLANFVERAFEAGAGDKEAKARFMRGLGFTLIPPASPPGVTLAYELLANRNLFTGREITSKEMQGLTPRLRYDHYTSELAKQIGALGLPGMSPVVVDHVLQSLGSSAYRDIATMLNTLDPDRLPLDATDLPIARRVIRDARRGSASSQDFWRRASSVNGSFQQAANAYEQLFENGLVNEAAGELQRMDDDTRAYAVLQAHFKPVAERLHPFNRVRDLSAVVRNIQREMISGTPVADTTFKDTPGEIPLTATVKGKIDDALSELVRREIRNALVMLRIPGWTGKKMLDTEYTREIIATVSPELADELDRRLKAKKVYPADVVADYWPELRERLLTDGPDAYLDDLSSSAALMLK